MISMESRQRSLLLVTFLLVTFVGVSWSEVDAGDSCKDTRHGVDSGLVRVPDFLDNGVPSNVTCTWSLTAPPGKKLLVKVDSAHFPPQDLRDTKLKVILDREVIDIPRNCARCLKEIVSGHSVQIVYSSTLIRGDDGDSGTGADSNLDGGRENENTLYADAGSFQIRYKAFDPLVCDKPRSPSNGLAIYANRKVGQSVRYRCNPPYDLFGKNSALCQIGDTPVPEWSNGPPKCGVSNCSNVPITRRVVSDEPGAIASPGYPNFKIHSNFDCEWVLRAEPGYQISAFLSFLELENIGSLRLYDGLDKTSLISGILMNVTTRTNVLTVIFSTNNSGLAEGGFYLSYNAVPGSCASPFVPDNGQVIGYSFLVGSTVAFRCNEGFNLLGANQARCHVDGRWTNQSPICQKIDLTSILANQSNSLPSSNKTLDTKATLIPTTLTSIVTVASTNMSTILEATDDVIPTLSSFGDTLPSKVTESPNFIPSTDISSDSDNSGEFLTTDSRTTRSPITTLPDTKDAKNSKKAKFVPSTKITSKSTAKPKRKQETVRFGNKDDSSVTDSVLEERTTTEDSHETLYNVKDAKVNPRTENGLVGKSESDKRPSVRDPEDKTYDKDSDDYLGGKVDVDDADYVQSGNAKRAPPAIFARPTKESVSEGDKEKNEDISPMTTYVAIGVGTGLLIILLGVIVTLIVYRKRFPVRMRFGRKFSTFENPMYVANKDQDAHHPRELKRLTV